MTRASSSLARAVALALTLTLAGARPAAAADPNADATKAACVRAAEDGQALRASGALLRARHAFTTCGALECPTVVRKDCLAWLAELTTSLPSLVFFAEDDAGHNLTDVTVSVDGGTVASRLDGKAVPVEPGQHGVRFQWGADVVDTSIVVLEGEKFRRVAARFPPRSAGPPHTSSAANDAPRSTAAAALPWVFGGVSVVSLGGFAVFGLTGLSEVNKLYDCKPNCSPDDVDRARTKYRVADVFLAVAVVAAGVATFFALRGGEARRRAGLRRPRRADAIDHFPSAS